MDVHIRENPVVKLIIGSNHIRSVFQIDYYGR